MTVASGALPGVDSAEPFALAAYLRARAAEGRLLDDRLVAGLPDLPAGHPLVAEFRIRGRTADLLARDIAARPSPGLIVEVGCGSGWLAARLARRPGSRVVGIDVEGPELAQARRVFGMRPGLAFEAGDARTIDLSGLRPHVVVLASVLQYLPDARATLERLLGQLAPGGSIHVVDSPIYATSELGAAAARSRAHYAAIGVPEMAAAYHHHGWDELAPLRPVVRRPPSPAVRWALRRLGHEVSPFPRLRFDRGG